MKKFAFKLLSLICCLCFTFPCFTACNKEKETEPKYKLEDYFFETGTGGYYQSLAEMQTIRTTPYPVDEESTLKVAFGLHPKPDTKVKITKITGTAFYTCLMYEYRSHDFNAFLSGTNRYIISNISIFDKDDEVMLGSYHHETNFTISQEIILSGPEVNQYGEIQDDEWDRETNTISFKIYDVPNIDTDIYFNITNLKVWFEPIV